VGRTFSIHLHARAVHTPRCFDLVAAPVAINLCLFNFAYVYSVEAASKNKIKVRKIVKNLHAFATTVI
jgi:hypothetical protein